MKEKIVKFSDLNLNALLRNSIKVVENNFKAKYLSEGENLSDYGFDRQDLINSFIELLTTENKDIFIPFAYKKVSTKDEIHLLDGNKIFNENDCANIGDLVLNYTSDIGFLLSYDDGYVNIKTGYALDGQAEGFNAKENTGILKPKMESYLNRFICA
ncbi:MAG: hypothetical protein Q4B63_09060 [Clostridium perfringens]|nr:hypothetical protein [Clostridium perfringens]